MNKRKLGIVMAVLAAAVASAGTIKVWTAGEYITATDLNANFAHIHNTMVGGHGPRLVNADVSGSAAIAHSKLATPALLPKAWVTVLTACSSGTCTMVDNSGIAGVTYSGVTDGGTAIGQYTVTFTTPRSAATYAVLTSAFNSADPRYCLTSAQNTGTFIINCYNGDGGAPANTGFTALVLDSEN